jgi:DEAD/DEAH box helicase domain-containing protein
MDFDERKAYVHPVNVEYYTDAIRYTQVRILDPATEEHVAGPACRSYGDVLVRSQVVGFKKIKFWTNENIGAGKLEMPENEMHTTAYWITLERRLVERLPFSVSERQNGMLGLLHALASMATLLLMCDPRDLGTAIGERPPAPGRHGAAPGADEFEDTPATDGDSLAPLGTREFFEPNLYLYDAYPGGIGFSEPLFRAHGMLLERTRELIAGCPCEKGCPSCVGPGPDLAEDSKRVSLEILKRLGA